jgi:hypothetical protein
LFSLFFLGALGATVFAIQEGMPLAQAAGIVFAIVVWFLLIFLSGILLPAALLLLVDMGRNVRAVRKTLGQ